ncbi:hypothetical protein [Bradyrhizobium liaoningense]|uniref:hypothetical protein n=1 Tax=Bradyrhizobium liaoningense TaxID=43992 RepID=UPI001BA5B476|nr:hypothetical protein [Bradyrhizobium liaoningense]MBR0945948.1 hypothetical protein [Bradyrhizobium liaoningense]
MDEDQNQELDGLFVTEKELFRRLGVSPKIGRAAVQELERRGTGRTPRWDGGFAQLTTVTRESIATRIIHRWLDDVLGKKLVPGTLGASL